MATYGISVSQFDDASIRGTIKSAFRHKYRESTPLWQNCGFQKDDTESPFEEYTSVSGIGVAPRKEQFQQIAIDVPKQNYTKRINVLQYAIMVPVSEEALRWLKKGKMSLKSFIKPSELCAESIKVTNELLAADVFGNAFSSTVGLGMDGQPLISASHKLGRGGTGSNYIGKVSLSQSGLEAGLIQGNKMPDDVNLPVGVGDNKKRLIVIQEDERYNAKRIIQSTLQSDTNNNAINALKGDISIEDVRPNRYLPSTSNWFIVNQGVENALICLEEMKADMRDHGDDKRYVMYFSGYESIAFDWFEWRGVQGSDF
jgi:hypothetical protein